MVDYHGRTFQKQGLLQASSYATSRPHHFLQHLPLIDKGIVEIHEQTFGSADGNSDLTAADAECPIKTEHSPELSKIQPYDLPLHFSKISAG